MAHLNWHGRLNEVRGWMLVAAVAALALWTLLR